MNAIERKLTKARIALITLNPFYGTLALRLKFVERPGLGTIAVDGKHMFYDPKFIEQLSHEDTQTVVAHEVMHCVYDHIGRRGARSPEKWNVACDYVVNAQLKQSGFDFKHPSGWLLNPQWGTQMSADQVYNLLPDPPKDKGGKGGAMCEIMQGEAKKEPAMTEEWQIATVQAAMQAQQAGKLPEHLKRFVDDMINTKTDWKTQLRRFVTEVSKDDYSWARPQRKMLAHGIYLPSLHSEQMGEIDIIVDTSGSITQKMLNIFAGEIQAIRDAVRPQMTRVIYCDAEVNHVDEFTAEDLLECQMHGGGGTDFRPPFEKINEEGWKPAAIVYLTDGYGPFPDAPPEAPTMWCMTTDVQPPWGECLQVDPE